MGRTLWCTLLFCYLALPAAAIDLRQLPQPTGYVNDLANVVDSASKTQLEDLCTQVEQQLGVQLALVTIDTTGDRDIRDAALTISRNWGVGSKKDNQGVLLLLAINDHKSDIEVGRGIEPYLTDGFSGSTLRAMRPQLRASQYGPALLAAAQAMAGQIAQGKNLPFNATLAPPPAPEPRRPVRQPSSGLPVPLIALGIFVLLWLFSRGGRGGGRRYGSRSNNGFVTGMLLGSLLNSGGPRRDGDWGGGGFGGDSGGGGGFGGFGGGDFGGGGASSDW